MSLLWEHPISPAHCRPLAPRTPHLLQEGSSRSSQPGRELQESRGSQTCFPVSQALAQGLGTQLHFRNGNLTWGPAKEQGWPGMGPAEAPGVLSLVEVHQMLPGLWAPRLSGRPGGGECVGEREVLETRQEATGPQEPLPSPSCRRRGCFLLSAEQKPLRGGECVYRAEMPAGWILCTWEGQGARPCLQAAHW